MPPTPPTKKFFTKEGKLAREEWRNNDGQLHRDRSPAYIEYYPEEGIPKLMKFYKNGKLHNKRGAAVVEYSRTNPEAVEKEEWWKNGILHRENGPAITLFDPSSENNNMLQEEYFINGKRHRVDGPAVMRYSWIEENRIPLAELYYENDLLHRTADEPAAIYYYPEDGIISMEVWFQEGKFKRDPVRKRDPKGRHFRLVEGTKFLPTEIDYVWHDTPRSIMRTEKYREGDGFNLNPGTLMPSETPFNAMSRRILHNIHGPAVVEYSDENKVTSVKYYINGQLHREDGPALISYTYYGKVHHQFYYLNGIRVDEASFKKRMHQQTEEEEEDTSKAEPPSKRARTDAALRLLRKFDGDVEAAAKMLAKMKF